MKKELHLVIGFDSPNTELTETITEIVVIKAREIWGAAHIAHNAAVPDAPPPDLHLYSDDFLMGKEDIDVHKRGDETKSSTS